MEDKENTPEEFVSTEADAEFDAMFLEEDNEVYPEADIEESKEVVEETKPTGEEKPTTEEIDYTPFLKTISEKAKYNHEPVNVESLDEVVSNFSTLNAVS